MVSRIALIIIVYVPLFFIKSICCFSLCLKYTLRNSTEKTHRTEEIFALLNIFGFALVTSLQTTSASLNNKGRYQERGICDDPYTAVYESPFTANYAGLFLLRIFVKIGIELSSIVLGGMMLIVFGCIINAVIRQMWPSTGILIVMEACLVMICVAAGVLEFFLEEATTSLGRIIRS